MAYRLLAVICAILCMAEAQSADSSVARADTNLTPAAPEPQRPLLVRVRWAAGDLPAADVQVALRVYSGMTRDPFRPRGISQPCDPFFLGNNDGLILGVTNAQGDAALSIPASWKGIVGMARHAGAADATSIVNWGDFESCTIRLEPGAKVSGRVWIEGQSEAASGARVKAFRSFSQVAGETVADAAGSYRFEHLPVGETFLVATRGNLVSMESPGPDDRFQTDAREEAGSRDLTLRPGRTLQGLVTRLPSREPIAGAKVSATLFGQLHEATTGADGAYRLEGLTGEVRDLVAEAAGFAPMLERNLGNFPAGAPIHFDMREAYDLRVRVKGSDGAGALDVQLSVIPDEGFMTRSADVGAKTGPDGVAMLSGLARDSSFVLRASGKDGSAEAPIHPLLPGGEPDELTLTLARKAAYAPPPPGVVAGTVKDEAGRPVAGARVGYSSGSIGNPNNFETKTNEKGEYRFQLAGHGPTWSMFAQANGLAPSVVRDVKAGDPTTPGRQDFTLGKTHWLALAIVDEAGMPVAGAKARLTVTLEANGAYNPREVLSSDAAGKIRYDELPAGTYSANIQHEDFFSSNADSLEPDAVRKVVLAAAGLIRGRVVDAQTKAPIESFKLYLMGNLERGSDRNVPRYADGLFEAHMPHPGSAYSIEIEAEGYVTFHLADYKPKASNPETISVELQRATALRGRVSSAKAGAPIAGARIMYVPPQSEMDRNGRMNGIMTGPVMANPLLRARGYRETFTGEDGTFMFLEPTPNATLHIDAAGHAAVSIEPSERVRWTTGGDVLSIALKPESSIAGVIIGHVPSPWRNSIQLRRVSAPESRDSPSITAEIGANGAYRVDRLAAGDYIVHPNTSSARRITLAEGEARALNLGDDAGAYRLSGVARDADGKPLEKVSVSLTPQPNDAMRQYATVSGSDGRYEIAGLAGKYRTNIYYDGERREDHLFERVLEIEIGADTQLDFRAKKQYELTGRVAMPKPQSTTKTPPAPPKIQIQKLHRPELSVGMGDGSDPETFSAESEFMDGQFRMRGRFKGDYIVSIALGKAGPLQPTLRLANVSFANADKNREMAPIVVPEFGSARLGLEVAGELARAPQWLNFGLETEDGTAGDVRGVSFQIPYGGAKSETVVTGLPAGRFRMQVYPPTFGFDPAPAGVVIAPGKESAIALRVVAQGYLGGYMNLKALQAEPFDKRIVPIRAITIKGAGIERTLRPAPQEAGPPPMALFRKAGEDFLTGSEFGFQGLPPGEYEVRVEAEGYVTSRQQHKVVPGIMESVSVELVAE